MRSRRLSGFSRRLGRRVSPVGAAGAITVVATAMLVAAGLTDGFTRDLLVNLGASLAFVPPTYLVFAPIFERIRQTAAAIEEHLDLDLNLLVSHIEHSYSTVCILETWTGLLEDRHRQNFLRALGVALANGVNVRILLLDPTSSATQQRAEELGDARVAHHIADNLRYLHQFRQGVPEAHRDQLQIRVYDASPSVQLYRWDDKAFLSFFPIGRRAYDTRQIETYMANPIGEFAQSRFDDLWSAASTYGLDVYMDLPLYVQNHSPIPNEYVVKFVHHDGHYFIDGNPLLALATEHGIRSLTARIGSSNLVSDAPTEPRYGMIRLETSESQFAEVVPGLFTQKYGDAGNLIIHLVLR